MLPNDKSLEEVAKVIKSLVIARKEKCTPAVVDDDYLELEGTRIPFRRFGYLNLLSFLRSISSYIRVQNCNNVTYVVHVDSDKSRHVSNLVAGQKRTTKKIMRGGKRGMQYRPTNYFPFAGETVKRIPADTLNALVQFVKQQGYKGVSKNYLLRQVHIMMPYSNITQTDLDKQLKEVSHEIYIEEQMVFPIVQQEPNLTKSTTYNKDVLINWYKRNKLGNSDEFQPKPDSSSRMVYSNIMPAGMEDDNEDEIDNYKISEYGDTMKKVKSNTVKTPTCNFIQETISRTQSSRTMGTKIDKVEDPYLKYNSTGTNSTNDQFAPNGSQKNNIEKQYATFIGDNADKSSLIHGRIKFRLEKLIEKYPDGIWCADLPKIYENEYNITLNYAELGFDSVREFASYLPQIFRLQLKDKGDFILFNAKNGEPNFKKQEISQKISTAHLYNIYDQISTDEVEPIPDKLSRDTSKRLIPDSVLTVGETVGQICVTGLKQGNGQFEQVVVVEIFNPSFFWIRLYKKQTIFKEMMTNLHEFYSVEHEKYLIPPIVLEKGLNCACLYHKQWHRGIIKTVKPDGYVTVLFYDYGTVKSCPQDEIYFLHRKFSHLPALAIPCGLYNLKPCNDTKWMRPVIDEFIYQTIDKPFQAKIMSVNTDNNSVMLHLIDTSDEDVDFSISQWMLDKNLAAPGNLCSTVDIANLLSYEESILYAKSGSTTYEPRLNGAVSVESSINMPLISPQSTLKKHAMQTNTDTANQNIPNTGTNPQTNQFLPAYSTDAYQEQLHTLLMQNLQLMMQVVAISNPSNSHCIKMIYENMEKINEIWNYLRNSRMKQSISQIPQVLQMPTNPGEFQNYVHDSTAVNQQLPLKQNATGSTSFFANSQTIPASFPNHSSSANRVFNQFMLSTSNCPNHCSADISQTRSYVNQSSTDRNSNVLIDNTETPFPNLSDLRSTASFDTVVNDIRQSVTNKKQKNPFLNNNVDFDNDFKPTVAHSSTKIFQTNPFKRPHQNGEVFTNTSTTTDVTTEMLLNFPCRDSHIASSMDHSDMKGNMSSADSQVNKLYSTASTIKEEPLDAHLPGNDSIDQSDYKQRFTMKTEIKPEFEEYSLKKEMVDDSVALKLQKNKFVKEGPLDSNIVRNGENSQKKQEFPFEKISNSIIAVYLSFHDTVTYVIHLDSEGWMSISEFALIFTKMKTNVLLKLLKMQDIKCNFKTVSRHEYPMLFSELDKVDIITPKNDNDKLQQVQLMSLKSVMTILLRFQIIDKDGIQRFRNNRTKPEGTENSILKDIKTIFTSYNASFTKQ